MAFLQAKYVLNATQERIALGFAAVLTAAAICGVPSWTSSLADPCVHALIAAAVTILLLYVTRWLGETGIAIERVTLALFLAAMPVIYLERWFLYKPENSGSGWLAIELLGLGLYGGFAILGLKRSPWFLAAGIAAHGMLWDLSHLQSAYIPSWYAIGCFLVDVGLGLYVAARIPAWNRAAALSAAVDSRPIG
ncbi:MAG: hypothetical protein ABI823_04280 [Bryobacteraceae bacterium]